MNKHRALAAIINAAHLGRRSLSEGMKNALDDAIELLNDNADFTDIDPRPRAKPTWVATLKIVLNPEVADNAEDALAWFQDHMADDDVLDWAFIQSSGPTLTSGPAEALVSHPYKEGDFFRG